MIKFFCDSKELKFKNEIITKKQYELLEPNCGFKIEINTKEFFYEPDFPIFEFWQQLSNWNDNLGNFQYCSLETDDNPLIEFIKEDGHEEYKVRSAWQKFDCFDTFTKEELMKALNPDTI